MWTDQQRLERHEVEAWIAAAFPYPHFKASVTEKDEPTKGICRIRIEVTGPNGETLVANNQKSVYWSTRPIPGMVQFSDDWTA